MKIGYNEYLDKIYGGWFGKCIGGAAGAPVEGVKGRISSTMREILDPTLPNDDLDLQLLWLELLERKGPYLQGEDMAAAWLKQCWYPFGEYGLFLKNYMRGVLPPTSGSFNNRFFKEGMGCPIRSEIWAMVAPGNPELAAKMAEMDGSLDHEGNSVLAEVFMAVLESLAFMSNDLMAIIRQAVDRIPDCKFKSCVCMVVESYKKNKDFEQVVQDIVCDYSHPDFTNSVQNLGYTVLALLYGEGDMEKTINLALSCGYDTDCTCASAASVLGIMKGYSRIDDGLKETMSDQFVCGIDVHRRDNTICSLAEDTCRMGISLGADIENYPAELEILHFDKPQPTVDIQVDYIGEPAIYPGGQCELRFTLRNRTGKVQKLSCGLEQLPDGWHVSAPFPELILQPDETSDVSVAVYADADVAEMAQKNLLLFKASHETSAFEKAFGVVGSVIYKVVGPFVEPLEYIESDGTPCCHAPDCVLPPTQSMFSNQAIPEKPYLDEIGFVKRAEDFKTTRYVYATEDILPLDESFGLVGEAVFYAATDILVDEAIECYALLGNTDAYTLWINGELIQQVDENRVWQPQAHGSIVRLKKGANRVALKICREGYHVTLSFGLRLYNGTHFHRNKWFVDFASRRVD